MDFGKKKSSCRNRKKKIATMGMRRDTETETPPADGRKQLGQGGIGSLPEASLREIGPLHVAQQIGKVDWEPKGVRHKIRAQKKTIPEKRPQPAAISHCAANPLNA